MKMVILNEHGIPRPCPTSNCFEWVFDKNDTGKISCPRCGTTRVLTDRETEGVFPRPDNEFVDRLNQHQRYSFWRGENSVKCVPDKSGKWFEADLTCELMEEAQNEINSLRARLALLEPKGVPTNE